jgi:hypothetical protein
MSTSSLLWHLLERPIAFGRSGGSGSFASGACAAIGYSSTTLARVTHWPTACAVGPGRSALGT